MAACQRVKTSAPGAPRWFQLYVFRDRGVSDEVIAQALEAGLVDECHLFVAPIVVGGGKRSLPNDVRLKLELLDERRFDNGMVYLHYRTRT